MKRLIFIVLILFLAGCKGPTKKPPVIDESPTPPATMPIPQPEVKVFIENSGSMDGYVAGATDFKVAIYDYVNDIKLLGISDRISLHYINSLIIPFEGDPSQFIEKITPQDFRAKGGKRIETDLSKVLEMSMAQAGPNTIVVFISDCVFSPGKGVNPNQYLVNQQIGVKSTFKNKLDEFDLTTLVYQLSSNFDGNYYDMNNKPTKINAPRPYYMWVAGSTKQINHLVSKVKVSEIKGGGAKNMCSFFSNAGFEQYMVLTTPKLGSFERDKKQPKNKIGRIKKEDKGRNKGEFMFSIGANFSSLPLDDQYIMNPDNYRLSKGYTLEVVRSDNPEYTHTLKLTTTVLKDETVRVSLIAQRPAWVAESTSLDDTDILSGDQVGKTFGLQFLIDGIAEGYLAKYRTDSFADIEVSVNR